MSETEPVNPINEPPTERIWPAQSVPGRAAQLKRIFVALVDIAGGRDPDEALAYPADKVALTDVVQRAERQFLADHRADVYALASTYLAEEVQAARDALAQDEPPESEA
jgi:hypothetical protein